MSEGATAILTRAREDNIALGVELRARGVRVIELPCVRTERLEDTTELRDAIGVLAPADLVVLTSRVGVDAVASCARALPCAVAAVGPATAERARSLGMRVSFVPSVVNDRALARELPLPRGDVVLARSDLADGSLPRALRRRGARVREVVAYRTVARADGDVAAARDAIARGDATVLAASPSAIDGLAAAIDVAVLRQARFVAIGARTAQHARRRLGIAPTAASATDIAALADAIRPRVQVAS